MSSKYMKNLTYRESCNNLYSTLYKIVSFNIKIVRFLEPIKI